MLEALARIAGARGETSLAIQFLDGLSKIAEDPEEAALTYARGCGAEFGFDEVLFARHELHLHVPT